MRFVVPWLLLGAFALRTISAGAQAAPPPPRSGARVDGEIVAERRYRLAPFDSLTDGQRRELARSTSHAQYETARQDVRFSLRKLEYASDGLRVVAYVYEPSRKSQSRVPVIVYNRGSYVAGDQAPVLVPMMRRLAEAGFLVVAPQYRGSDGGEGRDDMGGADVADVMNAVRLAMHLPSADSTRIFMYGESRGGMMTYQALRDGVPVRAAAVVGAFTDLDTLLAGDPRSQAAALMIWPAFERDRATIAPRRSAVRWADSLRVPILILHGGADAGVSPRQAMRLALRLDAAKHPYELHIIDGGSHTLAERASLRDSLVTRWFADHTK
jgi:dipeptidyl aminopeptidase/acylaminoacyl peptidase